MTMYLENSMGRMSSPITTLSRFPASKVGPSLQSLIHSALDGVVIADASRRIVLVNERAEQLFGYSASQLLDKPLKVLVPARIDFEQRRGREPAITPPGARRARRSLKGVRSDGRILSLNASVSQLSLRGEGFLAVIVHGEPVYRKRDNAPRSPGTSAIRRWGATSQQAAESEKRRFSRKLYDDIGQRLSVLKLDLDWLETTLPNGGGGVPARVAQMQGLLDNVIAMTKNMASTLRPPLLDDFGLLPAVEWMAENLRKNAGVSCVVESTGMNGKLDDTVQSALFRVIQESVSNIELHSRAQNVHIHLLRTANEVSVTIRDDGVGMADGSENKPGCFGLAAMQERVIVLGGTITIRNEAPYGVTIQASIPIEVLSSPEPFL